jgi:hypothetical protein
MSVILRRTKWPSNKDDWSYRAFDGEREIGQIHRRIQEAEQWIGSFDRSPLVPDMKRCRRITLRGTAGPTNSVGTGRAAVAPI